MKEDHSQEEMMEQIQKIFEERGKKSLELAQKTFLEEKIESEEIREAINYFLTEYWHDVARPALLSLVCEAVGGDPEVTTPIAIPMSLISGAVDIHDDIIDQSKSKGSRPTIFGKFGKDVALLVGNFLLFKGFALLHEAVKEGIPADKIVIISDIIQKFFFELGDAETIELQFRGRTDVSSENYLRVVRKKAADVEAHTRISAILGNGTKKEIEALGTYGRLLGILIILYDDLADMIDSEEFVHRIRKEHLPLQVIYALEKSEDKEQIESILRKKRKTKSDVKKIVNLTNNAEGPTFVANIMKSLAEEAIYELKNIQHNKHYLQLLVKALLELPTNRRN